MRHNELTLKRVFGKTIRRRRIDLWGAAISKTMRTDQQRQQRRAVGEVREAPGGRVVALEAMGSQCFEEEGWPSVHEVLLMGRSLSQEGRRREAGWQIPWWEPLELSPGCFSFLSEIRITAEGEV